VKVENPGGNQQTQSLSKMAVDRMSVKLSIHMSATSFIKHPFCNFHFHDK